MARWSQDIKVAEVMTERRGAPDGPIDVSHQRSLSENARLMLARGGPLARRSTRE